MEYHKIISVTGLSGLYELVGSKTDGAIVRSLADKTTRFVASRVHNFSHLEGIEVYTTEDNVNLVEVFQAMKNTSETLPDEKDAAAVKAYFVKVYGSIDFDRVYASDMKKMVRWFSILNAEDIEFKIREEKEEETAPEETEAPVTEETPVAETPVEETPVDAVTKKAKKEKEATATGTEEVAPKKAKKTKE